MMKKKHYIMLADIICDIISNESNYDSYGSKDLRFKTGKLGYSKIDMMRIVKKDTIHNIVVNMIKRFKVDNRRFNENKFKDYIYKETCFDVDYKEKEWAEIQAELCCGETVSGSNCAKGWLAKAIEKKYRV